MTIENQRTESKVFRNQTIEKTPVEADQKSGFRVGKIGPYRPIGHAASSPCPVASKVQWTAGSHTGINHHMRVNLCGADIAMAQQVLYRAYVRSEFQ